MPVSTNALYAHVGRHRFLTQKAKDNKLAISWEARTQYRGKPLESPITVCIALYWPTHRNHDVDNTKALIDALTGILWLDDGQITDLCSHKRYDNANARVEIQVAPLGPDHLAPHQNEGTRGHRGTRGSDNSSSLAKPR